MTTLSSPPQATSPAPTGRTTFRTLAQATDRSFLALGIAARLPTAMLPLGILLYVADRTGSFASGGLAVAALSIGGGLGGPLVGAAADRFGQRPVLLGATVVQVLGIVGFLALSGLDSPALTLVLAAVIGLANPQAGAMARARWATTARDRGDRHSFTATAMAYEGAVDESSFVAGPVLVSTIAALASPTVGLVLALLVAVVAQGGFGLHHSALPGRSAAAVAGAHPTGPLPRLHLAGLLVALAAVGLVFGSSQTGVAARLDGLGSDELTGPVYAMLGVGSAVAGLLTTRLPRGFGLAARIAAGGAGLVVAGLLLSWATAPLTLAGACLVAGIALAPSLISSYALAERAAPQGWGTTMMTALSTANVVGVAAGAAVAGQLVDRFSPGSGLLVVSAAGVLVLAGGVIAWSTPHHVD